MRRYLAAIILSFSVCLAQGMDVGRTTLNMKYGLVVCDTLPLMGWQLKSSLPHDMQTAWFSTATSGRKRPVNWFRVGQNCRPVPMSGGFGSGTIRASPADGVLPIRLFLRQQIKPLEPAGGLGPLHAVTPIFPQGATIQVPFLKIRL